MSLAMKRKKTYASILGLLLLGSLAAQESDYQGKVRQIDLINWTHTDYGFTDHPLIVSELQNAILILHSMRRRLPGTILRESVLPGPSRPLTRFSPGGGKQRPNGKE